MIRMNVNRILPLMLLLVLFASCSRKYKVRAEDDVERPVVLHGGFDVFYAEFFQGLGYFPVSYTHLRTGTATTLLYTLRIAEGIRMRSKHRLCHDDL